SAIQILNEELRLLVEVRLDVRKESGEVRGVHLAIHIAPIDIAVSGRVADQELVLGRAAGVRCGDGSVRSHVGELAFLTPSSCVEELRRHHVEMNSAGGCEALILE